MQSTRHLPMHSVNLGAWQSLRLRGAEERQTIEAETKAREAKVREEETSKPPLVRFFFVHKSKPTGSEEKRKPKRNA